MNKNDVVVKINKYGKIGKIITIIMLVAVGLSLLFTLIAAIALKCIPEDMIGVEIGTQAVVTINPKAVDSSVSDEVLQTITDAINTENVDAGLNLGAVRMKLNSAEIVDDSIVCRTSEGLGTITLNRIGNALFLAVLSLALTVVSIAFGCALCRAIEKCESPFADEVIKRMRYFAYSLIPWALFSSVPQNAINSLFGDTVEYSFNFNLNVIFAVLIILALTTVFKYGAFLQQESDETL